MVARGRGRWGGTDERCGASLWNDEIFLKLDTGMAKMVNFTLVNFTLIKAFK